MNQSHHPHVLFKKISSNETVVLSNQLFIADNLWKRMKGLLGKNKLHGDEMLWIHSCNSIHTFFMNFSIDCVFLDEHMVVQSIKKNIEPWKATFPVIKAISVIEMNAGLAAQLGIQEGDKLYVGN